MNQSVSYVQSPLRAGEVTGLGGFVGRRWRANVEGSVRAFEINKYLSMFERRAHRDWWWIGEHPGKWLESAVLCAAALDDDDLRQRASECVDRMVASQESGGYLGITDPAVRSPEQPLRGMDAYEQYFTFHGLLTAHEVLARADALDAARRLADYYLNHIGPGKAEFWPSPIRPPRNRFTIICKQFTWVPPNTPVAPELHWQSQIAGHTAHYGWEGTLVIDPILRLAGITGDARYVDFAKWVISRIDEWSGWDAFSRLDNVADGAMGVHELQPYVHAHTFHMNFLGFLRLYRITGDAGLLRKVKGAWDDIASRQLYITGGVSAGEHYKPGHERPLHAEVVETCANMSWMLLTQELLQLTGDAKYADVIERLLFNHVFASQTIDGESYRYHTPPNGTKPHKYFHGPDCCTSSGHRLVSMLPQFVYATGGDGVVLNQYVTSTARVSVAGVEVAIAQTTNFPQEEEIHIRISPASPTVFALRLRIPAWCSEAALSVNGERISSASGGSYLSLRRKWTGTESIVLRLPMRERWIEHDHLPEGESRAAIERGPVVFAVDTTWWDLAAAEPTSVDEELRVPSAKWPPITLEPIDSSHLGPGCRADLLSTKGQQVRPVLVPFANVGCWYRPGEPLPDRESKAFSYAVWLRREQTGQV